MKNNLKTLRMFARMTQSKLAAKAGVSAAMICNSEQGRSPSLNSAYRISRALGKDVTDIWPIKHARLATYGG